MDEWNGTLNKAENIRQCGVVIALDYNDGGGQSYFSNVRDGLYQSFLDAGILLRPLGNTNYILPPYCISESSLERIYKHIETVFR